MDLSKVSSDELRQEIERRKIALTKPEPVVFANTDIFKLQKLCASEIESYASGKYFKDAEQNIYEVALELFYGKDVWDWINKRSDEMDL